MQKTAILLVMITFSSFAYGEYRVYQYYVRPKVQGLNPTNAELVTSTLDPISYSAYHGGKASIEVNLLRSWMCMGNTANQAFCTISEGTELTEAPKVETAKAPIAEGAGQ
jgi:hypothetical protein